MIKTEQLREELNVLLAEMDVPDRRKEDYRWLNRNLWWRNSESRHFERAMEVIACLIRRTENDSSR